MKFVPTRYNATWPSTDENSTGMPEKMSLVGIILRHYGVVVVVVVVVVVGAVPVCSLILVFSCSATSTLSTPYIRKMLRRGKYWKRVRISPNKTEFGSTPKFCRLLYLRVWNFISSSFIIMGNDETRDFL